MCYFFVRQWFRFKLVSKLYAIGRPDGHERGRPCFHVVHGGWPRWRTPPTVRPSVHAPPPPTVQPRAELTHVAHAGGHTQVSGGGGAQVGRLASRGRVVRPTAGARTAEPTVFGATAERASAAAERSDQLQRHGAGAADERTEPLPPPGASVARPFGGAQAPGTAARTGA